MCTPLNIFIEVGNLLLKAVPFLNRHEEVLLAGAPRTLIWVKGADAHAGISVPVDQFQPVLVVIIFIKVPYQAVVDRHFNN